MGFGVYAQVGFVHMLLGLALFILNTIHFKDWRSLLLTAVPQVVFFVSFIGYLCFLIIFKWLSPSNVYNKPSIIAVLIDFLIKTDSDKNKELIMFQQQTQVQNVNPKP